MRSYHPAKFKFSPIMLGDKNATYLCSKIITTLVITKKSVNSSPLLSQQIKDKNQKKFLNFSKKFQIFFFAKMNSL